MAIDQQPDFLKASDLPPRMNVGLPRVYQLIAEGHIPAIRRGRRILIPARAFDLWLEQQTELALASVVPSDADGAESRPRRLAERAEGPARVGT